MPDLVHVNDTDFMNIIDQSEGYVLVDFWAEWCGPCLHMGPVFESLSKKYEGKVKFVKLNVDEARVTARRFKVMSIPTTMLFRDGKKVEQVIGALPEDALSKWIDEKISDH